jgi:hypothetical protein
MIWKHRGVQLTVEHYHGVPAGWNADIIAMRYAQLGGTYPVADFEIGQWSAPSFMTERYEWLRYRKILGRFADGVRARDQACAEIAIQYIELHYIGSYSGFIRAKLARALKSADLTKQQKNRLNAHFLKIVVERDYSEEFRTYHVLWRRIIDQACMDAVTAHFLKYEGRNRGKPSTDRTWVADLAAAFERRKKQSRP